jgi:hypothetical protein
LLAVIEKKVKCERIVEAAREPVINWWMRWSAISSGRRPASR